jgi:glycosyltransferase involved in cell wall biosynthesis
LNAWQHVEGRSDNVCLLIVGTGSPELAERIREQIRHLKLKRVKLHLRFISAEELVALYRAADVVVYPYRAITTSGALATGLALGKTIVASNLPVFRELLTDRENALLVDPENSTELAAALTELCENFSLRHQLAANIEAMNFGDQSWLSIAERTKKFYLAIRSQLV